MREPCRLAMVVLCACGAVAAGDVQIAVQVDHRVGLASPLLYGCSLPAPATPGASALLPELIRNGSFESVASGEPLEVPSAWGAAKGWALLSCGARRVIVREALGSDAPLLLVSRERWPEYHLTVVARKIDGPGGLRVLLEVRDAGEHLRWTLGNLGNRVHTLERVVGGKADTLSPGVPGRLEVGRCYRLHVSMARGRLQCSVDGRVIHRVSGASLRYSGFGLGAADATAEYLRVDVRGPKERLAWSLDRADASEGDTVAVGWRPLCDPRNTARCRWEMLYPANSYLSQRVSVTKYEGGDAGIGQDGIALAKGAEYGLSLFLRSSRPVPVAVVVRGSDGRIHAKQAIGKLNDVWSRHELSFKAAATDANATVAVLLHGEGHVQADEVSLSPTALVSSCGLRADVVSALRSLRPTVLRWPAGTGATHYNWARALASRDRRAVTAVAGGAANRFRAAPTGFGTHEFLQLCRELGAKPILVANPALGMRPALYWREYCNGPPSTRLGRQRGEDGHPDAYGVKHWELRSGWRDIAGGTMPPGVVARALREEDPSLAVLAPAGSEAGSHDVLSVCVGEETSKGVVGLGDLAARLDALAAKKRRVALADWSIAPAAKWPALGAAKALNVFARHAGEGAIATCRAVATPGDEAPGGALMAAGPKGVRVSPVYAVLRLFRAHAVRALVAASLDDAGQKAGIDIVAGRAEGSLVLRIVHGQPAAVRVRVALRGVAEGSVAARATVWRLDAGAQEAAEPTQAEAPVADGALSLRLLPRSVTVIVLKLKEKQGDLLNRS